MIWNEALETMPRERLAALQSERLRRLVAYVHDHVPFYRQRLDDAGIVPRHVRGLDDLPRLPFTVKADLRDHYPFGLFAVPMQEVIRLHASSGTTGKPTVVGYTRNDLAVWAEVCARCLVLSGARPGDVFQNAYGYGLFTGGLGMHYGAERMGLTTIPASGGNTARQLLLMKDFGTNVMACTPSYALTLADALHDQGIDPSRLPVRSFILGAEPWTDRMRQEIEARLHADAVNIYGLSEIIGPGVANESVEAKDGMHIQEDHFLPEIVDPEDGTPCADGTVGELVFTTLTKEALPLLRYRTGDLCTLTHAPCPITGRTHARMGRILGRVDDMLVIRGVNVFPTQIEAALVGLDALSPHYQLVVTRHQRLDVLEVQVEVAPEFFGQMGAAAFLGHADKPVGALMDLEQDVQLRLREALGLGTRITLLAPGAAPRSQGGKLSRVDDRRTVN